MPRPPRSPPKDDDASREAYVGAPKQAGFQTLQAFVDKRRSENKDPLAELKEDSRVQVLQDPCFARGFQIVYPKTDYEVDPAVVLDTDPQRIRHWESTLV